MKVYKFKTLNALCRFLGHMGGCSDVHVSVFWRRSTGYDDSWSGLSRLTMANHGQLTRLFPSTTSKIPLMVEFVWSEIYSDTRFPTYDDLARYGVSLNTMPTDVWERNCMFRADKTYVSKLDGTENELEKMLEAALQYGEAELVDIEV